MAIDERQKICFSACDDSQVDQFRAGRDHLNLTNAVVALWSLSGVRILRAMVPGKHLPVITSLRARRTRATTALF
jgi:hypothetical protein